MMHKPFCLVQFTLLIIACLPACTRLPQISETAAPASVQSQASQAISAVPVSPQGLEVVAKPTPQPGEIAVVPTSTDTVDAAPTKEAEDISKSTTNPCKNLGNKYEHDAQIGEIKEEYIGSWHAAPFVGSGYTERFVLFPSGNYLFFPSQYECDLNDTSCKPSPNEEGIWGVQDGQLNLAIGGDVSQVRSIAIGDVIDSSADESPYPKKTTFNGITYWLLSSDTNLWNPVTGELCD